MRLNFIFAIAALAAFLPMRLLAHDATPELLTDLANRTCADAVDLTSAMPLVYEGKEKEIEFTITAAAPCVTLSGQLALYAVFRLPTLNRPDIIAVDSEALAPIMFAPHLLLLDAQGAIKRDVSRDMVMFHGRDLRVLVRSHPDETYLVIASDSGLVGKSVSRIDDSTSMFPAGGPGLMVMVHTGSESTNVLSFSHTGKVEITLSPLPH